MLGETVAVRSTQLGLLLLLTAELMCWSAFVPCKPGNYVQHLRDRSQIKIMQKEDIVDMECCNSSNWVVNKKNGTLGVFFQLQSKPKYVRHVALEKFHSGQWITYTEEWFLLEDLENINGCGYHVFEYISSGRYRLNECYSSSNDRNITTMFDESKLNCSSGGHSPLRLTSARASKHNIKITYRHQLTMKMDRIYTLKDSNDTPIREWAIRARKEDSEKLVCETTDTGVQYEPVPDNSIYGQTFKIEGLYARNYTIEIQVFNPLSFERPLLNVCRNITVLQITELSKIDSSLSERTSSEGTSDSQVKQKEHFTVKFMIALAAVAVICCLCFVIYKFVKGGSNPVPPEKEDTDKVREDLTIKKVLLLYARDCPQFNDLMATFRDILKKNNFEVYDCYDPAHSRHVDERPMLWMQCLVKDSSVRVVVVSTKCARLQQLTLMTGNKISYKQPHYLDGLFLYGLHDTMSIHTNIYQKIYSVALEGFTQKEDTLNILSGSRVYLLPHHLLELFRDLRYNTKPPEKTNELTQQLTTFKNKLNVLITYANTEKDYLRRTVLTY